MVSNSRTKLRMKLLNVEKRIVKMEEKERASDAWQSILPMISNLADMEQRSSFAIRTLLVNQERESKLFRGEQGKHLVMG